MQRLATVPQALRRLVHYSPIAGKTANKVVTIGRITVNVCAMTGRSSSVHAVLPQHAINLAVVQQLHGHIELTMT
jgi:hypothetical protein